MPHKHTSQTPADRAQWKEARISEVKATDDEGGQTCPKVEGLASAKAHRRRLVDTKKEELAPCRALASMQSTTLQRISCGKQIQGNKENFCKKWLSFLRVKIVHLPYVMPDRDEVGLKALDAVKQLRKVRVRDRCCENHSRKL